MCLAVVALTAHPRHALVVAANRDEFHARDAAPAYWWDEGWLAGRDLTAGGTWLGVTRTGRWALLTNIREPGRHDPRAPSRGTLVTRFLAAAGSPREDVGSITASGARHNGFNLLAGIGGDAYWGSNRAPRMEPLVSGIHGLSNHQLDTPWPKVVRTKAAIAAWCAADSGTDSDLEPLFGILADRHLAADADLPATGIPIERERLLSAPFIVSDDYGTRCSTVLTITADGAARLVERTFDRAGRATGDVDFRFQVGVASAPSADDKRGRHHALP
jgi:uncharacterized protein with NRDE domain